MTRGRVRVGAAAARRRKAGGKLAVGRASATRAEFALERAFVMARNKGWCEVGCTATPCGSVSGLLTVRQATDFAHVIARSQGGEDSRFNALALCQVHHRMMEAPFASGRLVVTRLTVKGRRGFDWAIERAADKHTYRLSQSTTLAAGFIVAERV